MSIFYTSAFLKNSRIYIRGYHDGVRFEDIDDDYQPYIFMPDVNGPFRTIADKPVKKVLFRNIASIWPVLKTYRETETEFYGFTQWIYPYLNDYFPGEIQYDTSQISVVSLDIEVSSRNGFPSVQDAVDEVTAITLVKNGIAYAFGCKAYKAAPNQIYTQCEDEEELLRKFLKCWGKDGLDPDIVTGWSIEFFDIPYLVHRIEKVLGQRYSKKLSPFGIVEQKDIIRGKTVESVSFDKRKDTVYEMYGITVLDYLQLYKRFSFQNQESYALKHIAKKVLGRTKVEYDGTLDELYDQDYQTFITYNIEDALLVHDMDKQLDYINRVVTLAYISKCPYQDTLGTTRMWDVIICNWLMEKNIVVPQFHFSESRPLMGGYVKDPKPGMYNWVVSFDFDSLYPRIISQHNISPETFINKVHTASPEHIVERDMWPDPDGASICANGCRYRKDIRGFLPTILDDFIARRENVRKEMKKLPKDDSQVKILDGYQQALKIMNNGLYGAISMRSFRWFNIDLAESVTSTSQTCTRYMEKVLNRYLNATLTTEKIDYVAACDTDSVYLVLDHLVNKRFPDGADILTKVAFLDKYCAQVLAPLIKDVCEELNVKFNTYTPRLNMKREVIADKGFWRASKMYMLNVWDNEGLKYDTPQLKTKGIETVRSSTPPICREKIKEAIFIIFNKDEKTLQRFIADFKRKYMEMDFEEIATSGGISDLGKYYHETKFLPSTPFHVRGAIVHNKAIKQFGLEKKYRPIRDGEKIKFIYLKEPNPLHSHVIATHEKIPKEFNIDKYVDKDTQFAKKFLTPIESFTDVIGWHIEPQSNLLNFLPECTEND